MQLRHLGGPPPRVLHSVWLLEGCGGPVRARLAQELRRADRGLPDELHLRTASVRQRGSGLGRALPDQRAGRRPDHDLRRRQAGPRRALRGGPRRRARRCTAAHARDRGERVQHRRRPAQRGQPARGDGVDRGVDGHRAGACTRALAEGRPALVRQRSACLRAGNRLAADGLATRGDRTPPRVAGRRAGAGGRRGRLMEAAAPHRTETMRSAVISAAGTAVVENVEVPEPAPGQVRVRLEGSGVCGSDLPVWEGRDWFDYPREPGAPGHEGWGVVDALGEGVESLEIGRRVASLGSHAYADYDLVDAESVIPLPGELDGTPFPGEPLGCAVNVFRRSAIEPGQLVAVIGAGFLGSVVMQLALLAGARVIAISRRAAPLELARELGVEQTLTLDDDPLARIESMTGGVLCDRVIEAAGKQETLDLAGALTRVRGRLVIAGYHQDGPRTVDMQTWNWRGLDVVNAHERDPAIYVSGVREAARLVAQGELDPSPLYTHRFGLED